MPMASKSEIDRVMNILLNHGHDAKRAVLRTTPINPPHGDKTMFTSAEVTDMALAFSKLKIVHPSDMIRFIKLGAVDRDHIGAMTFVTRRPDQLPTVASRAGWVPCWFLPWASARVIQMKISSVAASPTIACPDGVDPVPNPDLFFTAGINGCSVFAIGDATGPTVYHGGVDPGSDIAMPLQDHETTEAAWRRIIGRAATTKFVGSVGKHDYITELTDPNTDDDTARFRFNNAKTTRLAATLEDQLMRNGQLTRVMVAPWGAVFGLRNPATNQWTMTLVRNAVASSFRLVTTVKKRYFRRNKVITTERGELRPTTAATLPMTADGVIDLDNPNLQLMEQCLINCVNLGFKEFFPGGGQSMQRDITNMQVF